MSTTSYGVLLGSPCLPWVGCRVRFSSHLAVDLHTVGCPVTDRARVLYLQERKLHSPRFQQMQDFEGLAGFLAGEVHLIH